MVTINSISGGQTSAYMMAQKFPEKFDWFVDQERTRNEFTAAGKPYKRQFRDDVTFEEIRKHKTQLTMMDLDGFTDCDSGFCGM